MTWEQTYDPLHCWPASTLVSALPVLTLFFVMLVLKMRVWLSALAGLIVAIALAVMVFRMPAILVVQASLLGFVFGLLRIAWIIVASIFLYQVAVETGQFQVMRESITALSGDRSIQVIVIAFCFGAFLEGTGGGGAPVAIAGAFLIGLGFPPFEAATVCLLANTAPVAWGAAGNPIRVLSGVTGLPEAALSAMTGRILPVFSFILPLWLVRSTVSWRRTWEVLPAILVSGAAFAGMQFFWSNYVETNLVDIVAAIFSLLVMVGFLRIWQPRQVEEHHGQASPAARRHSLLGVLRGWSPFILSSLLIFLCGMPSFKGYLQMDALKFPIPVLDRAVLRMPPVAAAAAPEEAMMDVNLLSLPGTAVFVGAFLSALLMRMPPRRVAGILARTVRQMIPSLLAISFMVGLAFVTRYSGMDAVLGLSLTRTGWLYPVFGTLLGWLGVALTGTDAGSNALFGNLQKVTAAQLGVSPVLMASANSAGGVMGKMIDAQSIVVASTSTGQEGNEAAIFKAVFKHSIVLAILVALVVLTYAYVCPQFIPTP